jgi:integrase
MERKATFNLREPKSDRPTSIFLVYRTVERKQIKINIGTDYKVCPKHWNNQTQRAKTDNSLAQIYVENNTQVNNRIKECQKLFDEWKEYIANNTHMIYDSETLLRKYISGETTTFESNPIDWFKYCIDEISNAKTSSRAQYKRDVTVFERFVKEKKIRLNTFSQFNYDILKKYEAYLIEKEEKIKTINNKISTLTVLLNHAENYSLVDLKANRITKYKKLKDEIKDDNSIYLTEAEITGIYNLELSEKKKTVRDIFVVQYYLGQRISDISNLKNATIRENEIELYQKKTGVPVTIPLINPIVKEILSRYNYSFPDEIVSSTNTLNRCIKEIAKEAGINEKISYREQKGTNIEIKKAEKWELITTHTARHSFATNMLLKGYPKEMIKKITGHKTDFAFQTYNNITSKDASKFILEKESELKKGEQPIITQGWEQKIDSMDNNIQKESDESFESAIQPLTGFMNGVLSLSDSYINLFFDYERSHLSIAFKIQKHLNNPQNIRILQHYRNVLKRITDKKIEEAIPDGLIDESDVLFSLNDEARIRSVIKQEINDVIDYINGILDRHKTLSVKKECFNSHSDDDSIN